MNRREFLGGLGAGGALPLLAAGCGTAGARCSSLPPDFSLGPKGNLYLPCPGLAGPVRVWVAGDTHFGLTDERDAAYADNYKRMAQWPAKKAPFEKMLARAKEEKINLLLLVGDNISFPTLANVEYLKGALDASGIDWLYVAGNHDWHFEGDSGSDLEQRDRWIAKRLKPLYRNGDDPLMYSHVVKGIRFVAIDDSAYLISARQLEFWRQEAAKKEPIILFMHIPLHSEGFGLHTCGCPGWGAATDPYWEIERRQRWAEKPTPESFAFREAVLSAPNVLAVFTGHIHRLMAASLGGCRMFSVPANKDGSFLDVTIRS